MKKIFVFIIIATLLPIVSNAKDKLPRADVVSMFLDDRNADINDNYILNFFIGELAVFLEQNNIQAVYNRSMYGVPNGWYMKLEFSGRTILSSKGEYKYTYKDVGIFCIPADRSRSDEGYWIDLGDFTVGTQKGDLVRFFKRHLSL